MNEMSNLVSIIVPVYNAEKYLCHCLDSIISQDYRNLEIILINDGSTDTSLEICQNYASKDSRIVLISKENGGQSSARNIALDVVRGEWVMFIDSDDEIRKDMVSTMLDYAILHTCEIVRCSCMTNGINGKITNKLPIASGIYERERINELIMMDVLGSQPCFGLYRSFLWKDVRFPEGRIYEDLAALFRVYFAGTGLVGLIDEPLYVYNLHDDSTSFKVTPNKNYDRFIAYQERYDFAKFAKLSYEAYCFHLVAITALGTYNYYLKYKSARIDKQKLQNVFTFLRNNKDKICQDKFNSSYYRMLFRLYYYNRLLYAATIQTLNLLTRWRNNIVYLYKRHDESL